MRHWLWLLFFSLFCLFFLGLGLYQEIHHISSQPISSWTEDQSADCAVVLTGSPGRVREGIDLLTHGSVQKLILSGVFPHSKLKEILPMWPYYANLREEDVILEKRSSTTFGNAQQVFPLVEALRCRDIILVTDQLHMHRALKTFKAIFPSEFPIYGRSTARGSYSSDWGRLLNEATRSLFYSLWAY